ncbi:MAG: phosphotransferase [Rhodospirillaceae bacterium]|nr:phosphotransferase [Rhodospirillaceae bacterium]
MINERRERAIVDFLARAGWADAVRRPLAGDASFRRYERLERAGGRAVLMDAPPPQEDVRPFATVAGLIRRAGLSAPEIFASEMAAGLLLIEDFGDDTYTRLLARGADERRLYELAVDALIDLHRNLSQEQIAGLPSFDDARCVDEAMRLIEWLWPTVHGAAPSATIRRSFESAWRQTLPVARRIPDGLMHYDYHVDNLMLLPGRSGAAQVGLLDFQDATRAPVSFDLASLLQDVRRDVGADLTAHCIDRYLKAFPQLDPDAFAASYAVLGAQRNTRILGTFVRLWVRDGKPGYLNWLPRTWAMVTRDLDHPAMTPVRSWFDRHLPPSLRSIPPSLRTVAEQAAEDAKARTREAVGEAAA